VWIIKVYDAQRTSTEMKIDAGCGNIIFY